MLRNKSRQFGFAALALVSACSSEDEGGKQDVPVIVGGQGASGTGLSQGGVAGTSVGAAGTRAGAVAGGSAPVGGGPVVKAPVADGVPCDVASIVGANCVSCHGTELRYGAPMALSSLQDFRAASKSNAQRKVYEIAHERVMEQDTGLRMPPVSKPALVAAELTKLSDWLGGGAQMSSDTCAIQEPETGAGPVTPIEGGSGGASTRPIEYNDPDLQCYKFTAYAAGQRDKKFSVPTTPDVYFNFVMKAPWEGTKYVRSLRAVNDNLKAIHHWIFFKDVSAKAESVSSSIGAHPSSIRMYGWSPGADDVYFDPDVGMKVESNVSYTLETHYNNTAGAPVEDASGIEICVTSQVPKFEAGQAWVGTDAINGTTATGKCTPTNTEPVHVIAAHPHMHKKGKHMKVVVTRKDGSQEVVHDDPFSFDYQKVFLKNFVLNPGDTMATTCTWSSPATFGTSTNSEMCFFFPVYWPAGALVGTGAGHILASTIHGPNTCMN